MTHGVTDMPDIDVPTGIDTVPTREDDGVMSNSQLPEISYTVNSGVGTWTFPTVKLALVKYRELRKCTWASIRDETGALVVR